VLSSASAAPKAPSLLCSLVAEGNKTYASDSLSLIVVYRRGVRRSTIEWRKPRLGTWPIYLLLPQVARKVNEKLSLSCGFRFLFSSSFHDLFPRSHKLSNSGSREIFEESADLPTPLLCFFSPPRDPWISRSRTLAPRGPLFFFTSALSERLLSSPLYSSFPSFPPSLGFVVRSANRPAESGQQRCPLVTVYPSRQRGAALEQSEGV